MNVESMLASAITSLAVAASAAFGVAHKIPAPAIVVKPSIKTAPVVAHSTPIIKTVVSAKEITRGNINKKEVIFTFDGGGSVESADGILKTLVKHHIKGTFFLTGKMIEANPDLVRRIASEGHEIFSHTYDHADLTKLSDDQIVSELVKTEGVLLSTANVSPKPYFRPPFGARNSKVLLAAAKVGYQSVYWTVDAHDWMNQKTQTNDQSRQRILSTLAPGNIYLLHLGDSISGAIIEDVITTIESKGYKIVSLTEGL